MTVCARRGSRGSVFGRGFDSPRLHQSRARRTMQVRLAFVLLRRSIWSAMFSSWSARSAMLGNKKSGYRTVSLLCGSRFVFRHSHNLFRYIQKIHGDSSLLQKVVAVQAPAIYRLDSVAGQLCYIVFKLRVIITVSFVGSDVPERLVEMIFGVALAVETFIAEA